MTRNNFSYQAGVENLKILKRELLQNFKYKILYVSKNKGKIMSEFKIIFVYNNEHNTF